MDFRLVPETHIGPIARVVNELVKQGADPSKLLLTGAHARDVLQVAGAYAKAGSSTTDIDFAYSASALDDYSQITLGLHVLGDTRIRYSIEEIPVDLIPFGPISAGKTELLRPPNGPDLLNIRYYEEVFKNSLGLRLPSGHEIRIPTIAGYCLLKFQAFADRSKVHNFKDFSDLLVVCSWISEGDGPDSELDEDTIDAAIALLGPDLDFASVPAFTLARDIRSIASEGYVQHLEISKLQRVAAELLERNPYNTASELTKDSWHDLCRCLALLAGSNQVST